MRIEFVLLADGAVQRPDGKVDLFGAGFDTIWSAAVPVVQARLVVVTRVSASSPDEVLEPTPVNVVVTSERGEQIATGGGVFGPFPTEPRSLLLPGQPINLGLVAAFENLGFPAYGRYTVTVEVPRAGERRDLPLFVVAPQTE